MTKKDAQEKAKRLNVRANYLFNKNRKNKITKRPVRPRAFVVDTGKKGKGVLSKLPVQATGTRFDVVTKGIPMKKKKAVKKFADGTKPKAPNFSGRTAGASTLSLRRRGLDKGRRDMLNTFKEAKRMNKDGRLTLSAVESVAKRNKAKLGKASTKAMKARGLKRGGKAKK